LLGALPPATFVDWRYLAVAASGGLIAFMFSRWLTRFTSAIDVLDAAGLSLFAVTGAGKALELGAGPAQAIILGAVTGVGGGTVRDVLIQRLPSVLSSGLYAIRLWSALRYSWPPTAAVSTTCSAYRWRSVRPWCAS
jgi:uncharacterized membrane protein YeiH